ncbi:hypothetical protein WBP07_23640 [Novosphingobium sp. BL-8A]|uniref:hypothetical protein n=1 Tax=Novosphingobium sp. BL-8A TaxID=3127639 RepID=UPI0037577E81
MSRSGMKCGALVGALLLGFATSANAYDGASISISGRVPTVCQVSVAGSRMQALQTGANDLGVMHELCNDISGYTVTLYHPAGLIDAWVDVGGVRVPISPNETHTVIVDNRMPAYREQPLRLVLNQTPDESMNLSLEAEPKGAVF